MTNDGELHNEPLAELLRAHGVESRASDGWLLLPEGQRARALVWDHSGGADVVMVQLDVVLELWTGRWIVESCAGYGGSRAEAVAVAFDSFAQSSLHPMLVAFLHTDHEVVRDAWEVDGVTRAVTIGDVAVRGRSPGGTGLSLTWFHALERNIKASSMPEGTHWIRLYHAQHDGNVVASEVLLDNVPWDVMNRAMEGVEFPKGQGFFSIRLFIVLQGGIDVSRAIARMIEMRGLHDVEIGEVLAKDGADEREVQALLAYVPLAFGRIALEELPVRFSATAVTHVDADDEGTEVRLADDPIFSAADGLGRRALAAGTLTQDEFLAVALRSAEVQAVNQAVQGGAEPEDLEVSAPVIRLY